MSERKYTADHEWIDDAVPARVGITDVACEQLGDIVFVSVVEAGTSVEVGMVIGEIESTKAVSELFSPAAGVIAQVNEAVIDNPVLISDDPFGEGWIASIEVTQLGDVLDEDTYRTLEH